MSDTILDGYLNARERILLVGPPGIAKTGRILAACKRAGMRLVSMRCQLKDRIDFGGCLVPDMAAGLTRALPLDVLDDLRTTTVPTLLFLDDLGQAPIDVQAAIMSLFDDGGLSPEVLIWGATNRPGDKAGVTSLCEPLRSRFSLAFSIPTPDSEDTPDGSVMLGTWQDEVNGWVSWALDNNAPASVVAFHRFTTGQYLYKWHHTADPALRMADYRSWHTVIRLMNRGLSDQMSIAGAIGKPDAMAFLAFAAIADQLASPSQVWMDPMGSPVPHEPAALFLQASTMALAVDVAHAEPFLKYVGRLPRVYGALAARDARRRLGQALEGKKAWVEWFTANQDLFI